MCLVGDSDVVRHSRTPRNDKLGINANTRGFFVALLLRMTLLDGGKEIAAGYSVLEASHTNEPGVDFQASRFPIAYITASLVSPKP